MKTQPLIVLVLCLLWTVPAVAQVGDNKTVLNFNVMSKVQLAKLPHLSAEQVAKVLKERPYPGIEKLHQAIGADLSKEQQRELYTAAFIPINLNAASDAEMRLIPGVGRRMAHEFDEYRPYKAMAQFRREIGKYVDKKEVARLESYVFIPIDLNKAPEAHLKTIPGVGPRMVHEFLEYRPYIAMAQFRREIGKYVDKKEVSRLERYFVLDASAKKGKKGERDEKDKKDKKPGKATDEKPPKKVKKAGDGAKN